MASGDGKFPINTRLLGTGDGAAPITAVFSLTQPSGKDIQDANTDFFFGQAAAPGTVCIAALMNATLVAKTVELGGAIQ